MADEGYDPMLASTLLPPLPRPLHLSHGAHGQPGGGGGAGGGGGGVGGYHGSYGYGGNGAHPHGLNVSQQPAIAAVGQEAAKALVALPGAVVGGVVGGVQAGGSMIGKKLQAGGSLVVGGVQAGVGGVGSIFGSIGGGPSLSYTLRNNALRSRHF